MKNCVYDLCLCLYHSINQLLLLIIMNVNIFEVGIGRAKVRTGFCYADSTRSCPRVWNSSKQHLGGSTENLSYNLALLCYCPVELEARADADDSVKACTISWMSGAATWLPFWDCHSTRKSKAACLSPCSLSNNSAKHPVCTQDWNLTSEYAQPTRADPFEIGWRQWRHLANLPLTWTPISTMPVLEWHRVFRAWLPTIVRSSYMEAWK